MHAFVILTVLASSAFAVLPMDSDNRINDVQNAVIDILKESRDLSAIQMEEQVKNLLNELDKDTRHNYELWVMELRELEKERSQKLKVSHHVRVIETSTRPYPGLHV